MAKIAYILLCHKDPEAIIQQAEQLTAAGDCMVIHFDGRASDRAYDEIHAALSHSANICFPARRIKCGWGEWSLVQATLSALETALKAFPDATHFYMLSGDCMAIKTAEYVHAFLDRVDADFIESFDFFDSDWIKTGMTEERLIYRHYFNERSHKRLFDFSLALQKKLGLARALPAGLRIQIGSQWWCLRRRTIEAILAFLKTRRDILRFFRTTWIPDETFFQTLVRHLIPEEEIQSRTLTFLMFTDYGMPVTFHNDHYDLLLGQEYLFARKISPEAQELKRRLGRLYAAKGVTFQISGEGRALYRFLAGRGRIGQRFAPRFWEAENSLGRERTLTLLVCKKPHLALRLMDQVQRQTGVPAYGFIFDDAETALPDLGGIETSLEKRNRHRRALTRMLFDHTGDNRLILCVDPSDLDVIRDFDSDRSQTRILFLESSFSESELIDLAKTDGLLGATAPEHLTELILPTLRNDLLQERDRLFEAGFAQLHVIRETDTDPASAAILAAVLELPQDAAEQISRENGIFTG